MPGVVKCGARRVCKRTAIEALGYGSGSVRIQPFTAEAIKDRNCVLIFSGHQWYKPPQGIMVEQKDIVISILGASVGLAGLLLVFAGYLFAQAAGLPSTTDDAILNKFKRWGRIGLLPFVSCLGISADCVVWMVRQDASLFSISWMGFLVVLAGTAAYGCIAASRL